MTQEFEHLLLTRIPESEYYSTKISAHLREYGLLPQDLMEEVKKSIFDEYKKLHDLGSRIFAYIYGESLKVDTDSQQTCDQVNHLQMQLLSGGSLPDCIEKLATFRSRFNFFGRNGPTYVVNNTQFLNGLSDLMLPNLSGGIGGFTLSQLLISPIGFPGFICSRDSRFDELDKTVCMNPNAVIVGYFSYHHPVDFAERLIEAYRSKREIIDPNNVYARDERSKSLIDLCRRITKVS